MRFLFILIVSLLLGCTTKFERQKIRAEQFYLQHPNEFAIKASEKFPVKEIFIPGVERVFRDTTVIVDTLHSESTKVDTIRIKTTITKFVDRVDTVKVENLAKVTTLNNQLSKLKFDLEQEKNKFEKATKTKNIFIYISIGLVVLFIGSGLFIVRSKF